MKIKEKSDIILTQYTGPSIVSENGISAKFKRDVSEYFLNSDIQRIRLVNAEDESPCSDVEWEDAVYNGETLINAVNYDWRSGVKNVKVYNGDKNECYLIDLISGERFFGEVPLYTHQPRLLKAVDKPDGIEEEQTVFIEDGIRTDDPSGKTVTVVKRVKNNTGTETGLTLAAAVYKDGRLMGVSAAEKTIPPSGFADGFEEIRLEMEFPLMKDGYSYKIMCWKDNMNPISKAEQRMGA